jgi:hypothetical protein
MTDAVLKTLSPRFARMYADSGRPSIPPEQWLRALLLQATHSAIDGRTTRHAGYAISQRTRKLIEQVFGWMKTVGSCASCDIEAANSSIGS